MAVLVVVAAVVMVVVVIVVMVLVVVVTSFTSRRISSSICSKDLTLCSNVLLTTKVHGVLRLMFYAPEAFFIKGLTTIVTPLMKKTSAHRV